MATLLHKLPIGGRWAILALIVLPFAGGVLLGRGCGGSGSPGSITHAEHGDAASAEEAQVWTCSMHPQIQQPDPGQCPICGMDLIPAAGGSNDGPARQLTLSPAARQLAEVVAAPVERRTVSHEIRMVGKIEHDETRVATSSAWLPGRLDR